tara:strand:+ start:2258 stop:3619 length:1362 start_codon:yes stop_codon:yes gene_type:complete
MPLTREERKLLHQKSKQPTFGINKPDVKEGHDGDIAFRQVSGSGTVQYVKENGNWTAISSSGTMPQSRNTVNPSSSGSITIHSGLSGLGIDDHPQYLLIDGTRAMTSTMLIGDDSDGADRSIVWGHSTLKTIMGIDDSSDAFVINTDDAFDATLANNSFSIDANHNVIIAGDVSVGDDLFLTSSGSVINWNSGDVTLTHASGKLTFGGDGTVELDFNNHEMTNVDIDSGAIDGTVVGANSQAAGDFTAIGAVSAGTIVGTTIDATTDFTIGTLIITDDQIQMTPSDSDTITIAGASNGVLNITTVDNAAAAANINITADGNIAITSANSITLDTAGSDNEVVFSNGGTERFAFQNDGSPEIDVTGNFTIDGSADITIDSVGDTYIKTNSNLVVHVGTTGFIKLHNYDVTLYQNYGIMNKKDKYHFTTGQADLKQNYSILSYFEESTTFETYPS